MQFLYLECSFDLLVVKLGVYLLRNIFYQKCFVVNMDLYKLFFYNLFQFSGVFCLLIIIIG